MKWTKTLLVIGAAAALSGCAMAEDAKAARQHREAKDAYIECLKAQQSNCATERAILDAASAYDAQRMSRFAYAGSAQAGNAAMISAGAALMQAGQPQQLYVYNSPVPSSVYRP